MIPPLRHGAPPVSVQPRFPGIGANFVHAKGDWSLQSNIGLLVRELVFHSATPGSFFTKMEVLGYRDGVISIRVLFDERYREQAKIYFRDMGLPDKEFIADGMIFSAKTLDSRVKLHAILSANNTLAQDHVVLVNNLAHAKDWHEVTPLQPHEELPPALPLFYEIMDDVVVPSPLLQDKICQENIQ